MYLFIYRQENADYQKTKEKRNQTTTGRQSHEYDYGSHQFHLSISLF